MTRIVHLIDDSGLGGVMRLLEELSRNVDGPIKHEVLRVRPAFSFPAGIEADVVVIHFTASWSKLPFLAALRALKLHRPILLVEHSYTAAFEQLHVPKPRRFRAMLRAAYALVDRVIAVSEGQAIWLRQAHAAPPHKIRTIRSVSNCDRLFTLKPPARRQGPLRLGAIGRYVDQKGFDLLVEAMRLVPADVATLSIAGSGPMAEQLQAAVADLPSVSVGTAVDVASWIVDQDAIVVPSRFEAFGLVALEARAAGRPVIASAVDGLIEQVSPNAGLTVPAGDPEALADAIVRLSQADLGQFSAAARASARAHIETSLRAWQTLFVEIGATEAPTLTPSSKRTVASMQW
jgi:D-inositol-3-phosphate glycosyltransferase